MLVVKVVSGISSFVKVSVNLNLIMSAIQVGYIKFKIRAKKSVVSIINFSKLQIFQIFEASADLKRFV